jgi:hypothetical protein
MAVFELTDFEFFQFNEIFLKSLAILEYVEQIGFS